MTGLLFADAPNPAYCPHHQCSYYETHLTSGGVAAIAIVAIVVAVLIVLIAIGLLIRRLRR
jgi:hypothetical protein